MTADSNGSTRTSDRHGCYTLHVHVACGWDESNFSALGFVCDERDNTVGRLALRGPFTSFQEARNAALEKLHELAAALEHADLIANTTTDR